MSTLVIDHGLCNLDSIVRALQECGATVGVAREPSLLPRAARVVLPGVGSFAAGMAVLRERGWVEALRDLVANRPRPLLGICLGMQMLAETGAEGGETEGLGLIPGRVDRIAAAPGERLPHIGWNEVRPTRTSPLFAGIPSGTDFYFVHSYVMAGSGDAVLAEASFGGGIAVAVNRGSVFGVQFHPEKSQRAGMRLLKNFLALS